MWRPAHADLTFYGSRRGCSRNKMPQCRSAFVILEFVLKSFAEQHGGRNGQERQETKKEAG
jgi:hypothetical protein